MLPMPDPDMASRSMVPLFFSNHMTQTPAEVKPVSPIPTPVRTAPCRTPLSVRAYEAWKKPPAKQMPPKAKRISIVYPLLVRNSCIRPAPKLEKSADDSNIVGKKSIVPMDWSAKVASSGRTNSAEE